MSFVNMYPISAFLENFNISQIYATRTTGLSDATPTAAYTIRPKGLSVPLQHTL